MHATLSPSVSGFASQEQATNYNCWLRAKVQASRDDPRPSVPHDQAMRMIREKLAAQLVAQEQQAVKPHRPAV